jgi:alkyl hydroperoxide reductase subunit AhpF
MPLISPSDQDRLRRDFDTMKRPVRLLFFTQTLECETCPQTRQILNELPPLSDRISIEEVNFLLEPDRAASFGIDRVPAIVVLAGSEDRSREADAGEAAGPDGPGRPDGPDSRHDRFEDTRMRFLGTPSGYEFMSLVHAVQLAGGGDSHLSASSRARLDALREPMTVRVFTTPTCPHCPRAVTLAQEMAFASPHVTAFAVEVTEFMDLARRYQVTGVPKTVVDARLEILGALPEDDFVAQALGTAGPEAGSAGALADLE